MRRSRARGRSLLLATAFALAPVGAFALAPVAVSVVDSAGRPVADAVVYALPGSGQRLDRAPRDGVVDQVDREFVPLVTPVQKGAAVRFPNKDNIRHQVYSFSPARTFTLKLYSGTPAQPVVFDKPGEVVLGCNIHDRMLGYIFVVDTPFFAKTDARGEAMLPVDVAGDFELNVWHPDLKTPVAGRHWHAGDGAAEAVAPVRFTVELAPRPAPAGADLDP